MKLTPDNLFVSKPFCNKNFYTKIVLFSFRINVTTGIGQNTGSFTHVDCFEMLNYYFKFFCNLVVFISKFKDIFCGQNQKVKF